MCETSSAWPETAIWPTERSAEPWGTFLRKYVLKNLPFKLVSLAIAILLWWAVGRDQPIEIPMTMPLEFQNAPANLEINSNYPFEARVTLRGPGPPDAGDHALRKSMPCSICRGQVPGESTFDLTAQPDPRAARCEGGPDRAVAISHQL